MKTWGRDKPLFTKGYPPPSFPKNFIYGCEVAFLVTMPSVEAKAACFTWCYDSTFVQYAISCDTANQFISEKT